MSFISLTGLAFAMLILAASPGPGVFATVAISLASGFRPALSVIAGIVVGDIVYLLFAVFGLSAVAQLFGELSVIVKICGGTYLVWLGFKIIFSEPSVRTEMPEQIRERNSESGNFFSGLIITLSNPKVILFYCGFLPTFADLSSLSLTDIVTVAGVVSFVLSSVLIMYAYTASQARRMFSGHSAVKRLNRAAGGVMIATGLVIATGS
ncbi:LysE family translocator [Desulfobacterales bacterium HSG2]|nr:LysE family translocator [Desulfobacterales bacterium HSG2]